MPGSACIGVIFDLGRAESSPGESIHLIGSRTELGGWHAKPRGATDDDALALRTSPLTYPRWLTSTPLWLEFNPSEGDQGEGDSAQIVLEYKYLRRAVWWKNEIIWEPGENRKVILPRNIKHGQIWSICDAEWGFTRSAARLLCDSLANVMESRCQVDPEWTASVTLTKAASDAQGSAEADPPAAVAVPLLTSAPPRRKVATFTKSIEEDISGSHVVRTRHKSKSAVAAHAAAPILSSTSLTEVAATAPASEEVEALKLENAGLLAALRLIAGEGDRARRHSTGTGVSGAAIAAPLPTEAPSRHVDPRRLHRRSCAPPGPHVIAASQPIAKVLSPLAWDWPLSRAEKKLRVHLADIKIMECDLSLKKRQVETARGFER